MHIPYKGLSLNPNCQAYIPKEISSSIDYFFSQLSKEISKKYSSIDDYCSFKLGFNTLERMFNCLSAEQIDAVSTIIYQIENKQATILADETGVGKGRTLASIYRYCKQNNKKMLFFTFNKDLFSDFIRDLSDIDVNDYKNIWVMHNNTTVYDQDSKIVFKASKKLNTQRINEKNIDGIDLMFCTYSQINTAKAKTKMDFLLKYCEKDTIVVLDESHNGAGQSTTKKNIEKLLDKSLACVYASATFLKNEDEFDLYKRALDSIDQTNLDFFKTTLKNQNSLTLRSYITKFLISRGKLIRREHAPMNTIWEHKTIDFTQYSERFDNIRNIFSLIFTTIEDTKNYDTVYQDLKSGWYNAGSHINRIFKNILLLSKIDNLCEMIEQDIKNNKKPVVVLESTFSAIVKALIKDDFDSESMNIHLDIDEQEDLDDDVVEKDLKNVLTLKKYLSLIIDKILFKSMPKFGLSQNIYENIEKIKKAIADINDSWCILSPIDLIINKLQTKSISVAEVSGRDFYIDFKNNGQYLCKRKPLSKTQIIKEFNNGDKDVAVITRTGSTGFSMHSSSTFKDQRQRVMYELEISNRPTVRAQFIGRVRRKGQVNEPEFKTIISNLPFEARLVENEQEKMRKMSAHISTDHNRLIGENIVNLYSEEADFLAKQILILNSKLAEKMGINLNIKYEQHYYIDMILKRSVILPTDAADKIYQYILKGLEVSKKTTQTQFDHNYFIEQTKGFINHMNDWEKDEFKKHWLTNKNFGFNNVDYNFSSLVKLNYKLKNVSVDEQELKSIYELTQDITDDDKKYLVKTLNSCLNSFYTSSNKYFYNKMLENMKNFKKGSYISFSTGIGDVFGFIEEIVCPQEEYLKYYPTHYLVKIRSLNFDKIPKNSAYENILRLTLNDLIFCMNLKIYDNNQVEFNKFIQNNNEFSISQWAILGNPIFISYLNTIYEIGQIQEILIDNKKYFSILIGKDIKEEVLFNLRKPVFNIKEIYKLLLDKKTIFSSPSEKYEGSIRLEPSTGAVILYSKNYNDKEIFDFAMYQVIGNGTYQNGEKKYTVSYKDLIKVCAMLNKRGVNFFIP